MNADGELRVLVADDDPSLLDLMTRRLNKMGISPDRASDGAQAQALIEQNEYDVIVTDIYMPEVTGLELLNIAKERDPNVQVVVATASATIDNAVDALNNGAFGYLTKPFDHLSVFDKVVTRAMQFRQLLLDNQRMAEVQKRRGDMLEEEVTKRIRQLRDRQRDLINLLTSLPLGVTVVEEGGRVVMKNPLAERWLAEEKQARQHPIREFLASVHETNSEPSAEVVIAGRTIRLTAVDILQGAPKKQKLVIIGEMQHEEEGISQGTIVEEAVDGLLEGLIWLASQPLEAKANHVARGLVREIVSLGRMMGLDIEDPVLPEVKPPVRVATSIEEEPEPAMPAVSDEVDDEDERFMAALMALAGTKEAPAEKPEAPPRVERSQEKEPASRPVPQTNRASGDDTPRGIESEREPTGPPAAAEKPAAEPPVSREITPPPIRRAEPEVRAEAERPPSRMPVQSPTDEGRAHNEAQPAPREEKKAPVFKSGLLRKAKELESGGYKLRAGTPAKSGTNGKAHKEPEEPSDNSVLSRLAQVTEDKPGAKAAGPDDAPGSPRPRAKPAPKAGPAPDDAGPRRAGHEESEPGSSWSAHDEATWPPVLPSTGEDEEEPSAEG